MRDKRQEVSSTVSPKVEGSSPVRGMFLLNFFSLIKFWRIWQNDLFTKKLEYNSSLIMQRAIELGLSSSLVLCCLLIVCGRSALYTQFSGEVDLTLTPELYWGPLHAHSTYKFLLDEIIPKWNRSTLNF